MGKTYSTAKEMAKYPGVGKVANWAPEDVREVAVAYCALYVKLLDDGQNLFTQFTVDALLRIARTMEVEWGEISTSPDERRFTVPDAIELARIAGLIAAYLPPAPGELTNPAAPD